MDVADLELSSTSLKAYSCAPYLFVIGNKSRILCIGAPEGCYESKHTLSCSQLSPIGQVDQSNEGKTSATSLDKPCMDTVLSHKNIRNR